MIHLGEEGGLNRVDLSLYFLIECKNFAHKGKMLIVKMVLRSVCVCV